MYYLKLHLPTNTSLRNPVIEFHNNWMGEETVIVNGQIVSKKSSIMGTNHYFTLYENTRPIRYILTTKVNMNMQVVLDLSRNGQMLKENVPIPFGNKPKDPALKLKKEGLAKLQEYDLEEALKDFDFILDMNPQDGEAYFHKACAYSVLEETEKGYAALQKAVECGLPNKEMILTHDMLAFLRMHDAFEDFLANDFKYYNLSIVRLKEEEFV